MRTLSAAAAALLLCAQPVWSQPFSPSKPSVERDGRVEPKGVRVVPRPANGRFDVDISTNRATYEVGDSVRIQFRANRDAYVYVFSTDARGRSRQIFPNFWDRDNFVRAGRTYTIPRGGYDLVAEPPYGRETISIVAVRSRSGIPDRFRTFSRNDPFPSRSRESLHKVIPRGKSDQVAEDSTTIHIRSSRRAWPPRPR